MVVARVRVASGARCLLPTGMTSAWSVAAAAQGSGEVGERGGPCPVFRARKTLVLNSAEHPEFPDRVVGQALATSSAYR